MYLDSMNLPSLQKKKKKKKKSDRKQGFGKYMVKNPCAPQAYHSYFRSLMACNEYDTRSGVWGGR